MTTEDRHHIKTFVDSADLYQVIKAYLFQVAQPAMRPGMTLQDYGAAMLAHQEMLVQLEKRFDNLKIDASYSAQKEA